MAVILRRKTIEDGKVATFIGQKESTGRTNHRSSDPTLESKLVFDGECNCCTKPLQEFEATLMRSVEPKISFIKVPDELSELIIDGEVITTQFYKTIRIESRWKGFVCVDCALKNNGVLQPYYLKMMDKVDETYRRGVRLAPMPANQNQGRVYNGSR